MTDYPFILLDDQLNGRSRYYENPLEIIHAYKPSELERAMQNIQNRLDQGFYVAGYVAYEAGLVFEPKLQPLFNETSTQPLLMMGVFENWSDHYPNTPCEVTPRLDLQPVWNEAEYIERFNKVLKYIQAGDVYQINLTFPLSSHFEGSALCLYDTIRARQPVHYGGVICLGHMEIVSFSPELFFDKQDNHINMRPMKGTVKRLSDPEADQAQKNAMRHDEKSRAENLMIVDLLRNDLSRIAEKASVNVPELFTLETYPTLHQMTSTVTARLNKDITIEQLFKNLFPCGSVTGAPKIRAMEIIHELENGPRGPYCGSIGYIDPPKPKENQHSGNACFNVAIRTAMIQNSELRYHVGSGVVLDSDGHAEYEECLLKAKVLTDIPSLVETFRWEPDHGIIRRKQHFARLSGSARTLGYPYDEWRLQSTLQNISGEKPQKCRLILSENGAVSLEHQDLRPLQTPVKLSLSRHRLTLGVQEYRHKVLARDFYDSERARLQNHTGCTEVIFLNNKNEICEGSFSNLFIEKNGQLYTPALSCGLLPGILRADLLERNIAHQDIVTINDLKSANKIFIGNSLRELMPAYFEDYKLH